MPYRNDNFKQFKLTFYKMITNMRTIKAGWRDREFGDGVGVKYGAVGGEKMLDCRTFLSELHRETGSLN